MPYNQPYATDLATLNNSQYNTAMANTTGGGGMSGTVAPVTDPMKPVGFMGKLGGLEGLSSLFQGLGSLGQIYAALQGVSLAKKQLAFQREAWSTNLRNQTKSYNTALEDRINSRHHTEGRAGEETQKYIAKHSL